MKDLHRTKEVDKYKLSGLLPHWTTKSWDDFTSDERVKKLMVNYLSEIDDAIKDKVGYFICGNPGVGKSMVAALMAKSIIDTTKYKVRIISFSGLIDLYKSTWTSSESKKEFNKLIQLTDFLFIDDFGKEYISKDDEGRSFPTTVLEDVINKRLLFNKVTFIVSSIDAKFVSDEYSAGLFSLVKEVCVPIRIDGKDYRDKINSDNTKKWKKDEQFKHKAK